MKKSKKKKRTWQDGHQHQLSGGAEVSRLSAHYTRDARGHHDQEGKVKKTK